jgi:hypothetical protein
VRFIRSKRGMTVIGLLLLAVLCLIRPGANRLRNRIVSSIGLALGRSVEVSSVSLRFLPQPGFELENFVVHDDPAFGAEPVLRAQEVTALLRVSSLLRGRLEISTLSLTEPSLNLVRNQEEHWNLENLVERADKISTAPTGKPKAERRPAFPYIEASHARVNFKFGPEKKPYALTDADFSLWQDSENMWSMRLKAQPVRTDFNLSDTGILRITGSWQRAATLRDTPLQFTFLWDRAQLGQLTKLAYGSDKGWRGAARIAAQLSGTPSHLTITAEAAAEDFRRYDISGGGAMRLAAQCTARYSSIDNTLSEAACNIPMVTGSIVLAGRIADPLGSRGYDLVLTAQNVPMQSLVVLARHVKLGLPDDLIALGKMNAMVKMQGPNDARKASSGWQGGGEITEVQLRSALTDTDLAPSDVSFTVSSDGMATHVTLHPFHLSLGNAVPAILQGQCSHEGYDFELRGEAQLQRLLHAARTAGLPALQTTAEGSAKLDLRVAGTWAHFAPPEITGRAHLRSVRWRMHALDAPFDIVAADLVLGPGKTEVDNLTATLAGTSWHGSLALPRPCAALDACPVRFDLHADQIATAQWAPVLFPKVQKGPWYRFGSASVHPGIPGLQTLNASGKLSADKIVVNGVVINKASSTIQAGGGKVEFRDLRAEVLGGRHLGTWIADLTSQPPQYSVSGVFDSVVLGELPSAMDTGGITGLANVRYQFDASGFTRAELLPSATGTSDVEVRNGTFPRVVLAENGGLEVQRLTARLAIRDGRVEIQNASLQTTGDEYQLRGSASLDRVLDLKLTRDGAPGFNITGTLAQPHVTRTAAANAQAELRPKENLR